ncbi:uncharacterized protein K460DRAFT_319507 [Cucurbitaria berberidis CBS 394.84]|uniref:Uncharacterized protein n=1 Tax=Cucurbitaria berberidis CBS 394.84 TaxID=1168544 RepID=A0A9P4GAA9_9PLEO|nr:uncharacterized protein K460DRAFT_319507 [Cucurbitaria berberidis CBS 394.84]KAF1841937.1 hypothetical protein K460DRAFT_319507 [Cucurbitaria berberidis CBS 394.84]
MSFQPVFDNFATRPKTATLKNPSATFHALIRDQFSILTWLLLGASIQALASAFLPYRNIVLVLPILLILSYKFTTTLLTLSGILSNPRMESVIPKRTSIVLPDEKRIPNSIGGSTVCAIILGVVSNHPLGMFGPGFKGVGDRFDAMIEELSRDATKHGFLGTSAWLGASERTTSNEYMSIVYFENEGYLHAFAHGPLHSEALRWWRATEKEHGHLGIMHEVFSCPKKSWEGIYINYQPTGLGTTAKEVTSETGQKSWVNPLVRVSGNKLLYSKGRMGRSVGEKEWDEMKPSEVAA